MVPAEFTGYFTAAAAAAGVLIGLLFVAVSLRPESVFSESAPAGGRALAGSAFTGLVNSFFVSLVALIPQSSLGDVAIIMAVVSLTSTVRLHHRPAREATQIVLLMLSLGTYTYQLIVGIILVVQPGNRGWVFTVAYLMIASFAVALSRAWALLQGKHLLSAHPAHPAEPAQPAGS